VSLYQDLHPSHSHLGVVGLTAALKFQEQGGYQVTIVAETLPSDPKNIRYTSPWAGAHHVSSAGHDKSLQSARF
jgi:D-amino-acid oxidase